MSYQVVALLVVPIVGYLIYGLLWKSLSHKAARYVLTVLTLLFCLYIALNFTSVVDRFTRRVNDGGAIRTTSIIGTASLFVVSIALTGVARGRTRYTLLCMSAVTGSALVTLQLIAWARGESADPYGYYGQKIIYTANYVSWLLLLAVLGLFLAYLGQKSDGIPNEASNPTRFFWGKTGIVVSLVAVFSLSVVFLSSAKSPAISIRNGWDSPSEEIVKRTLQNWKSGNEQYVFALYGTDSNDRLGNFWSPFFWEPNRWEWTYSGYNVEARSLCSVISGNEITLITDSRDLMRQMSGMCSASLNLVTVEN